MSGSNKNCIVYIEDKDINSLTNSLKKNGNFSEIYKEFLEKNNKEQCEFANLNVSRVTNMQGMFGRAKQFNQDIGHWDVTNVTNMAEMFTYAENFNQPIGTWNVSNVTNMNHMFANAENFDQPIESWNVSKVTNMQGMFKYAGSFNQPIGKWDVPNVTNMRGMFEYTENFNQPIGTWNVSNVTNMRGMFEDAKSFNQDIGNWNVSNVTNMEKMFFNAEKFNQPIGSWDVSNVINMRKMFSSAESFNQDISEWNVEKVQDIDRIGFSKPLEPLIAYSVYQWFLSNKISRDDIEKIFGTELEKYEEKRKAINGSLSSSRSSPSVETSLPPSIVYDIIELEEKPISAYKYSINEANFPILFADKNDYKVIMRSDLEKVLQNTNNIMYECKPSTPLDHLAITRKQVRPTAYLQTSILGIQTASVGVVELSSIQKTITSLKKRMDHNRKQTQKKLSAIKSNTSARKKTLLDTKIMPQIYKLKPIKDKKLERLASETVLQQKGANFAVSANHCQNMAPVQVYKLIKAKGKSVSKKRNASTKRTASKSESSSQTRSAKRAKL